MHTLSASGIDRSEEGWWGMKLHIYATMEHRLQWSLVYEVPGRQQMRQMFMRQTQ